MRISCLALARICDSRGRYLLLVNSGRLKHHGQRILSPVGGGLLHEPAGRMQLVQWGASFEGDGTELRFTISDGQVAKVEAWFRKRQGREASVLRELKEELTEEAGLPPIYLRDTAEFHVRSGRHVGNTLRTTLETRTVYLADIFNVRLPELAMNSLLIMARTGRPHDRHVHFVTPNELERQVKHDGTRIGEISQLIR